MKESKGLNVDKVCVAGYSEWSGEWRERRLKKTGSQTTLGLRDRTEKSEVTEKSEFDTREW